MKKNAIKQGVFSFGTIMVFGLIFSLTVDAEAFKRQSNNTNRVRVDILPIALEPGKQASFEIRMNTHSVTLNSDIAANAALVDNSGKTYAALKWDGTPPGSHHRIGVLTFPLLEGSPSSVTLVIRQVANVPERRYQWSLK